MAWSPPPSSDHPRSRGVYAKGWAKGRRNHGIIPARAGFTRHRPQGAIQGQDHPRSRGVYAGRECLRPQGPGSSPLARGLPDSVIQPTPAGGGSSPLARGLQPADGPAPAGLGIIPARAGFTNSGIGHGIRRRDHPRSRGVYARWWRGCPGRWRIIPARAGFTGWDFCPWSGGRDHPRSRGVYVRPGRRHRLLGRIIPARAGFTPAPRPSGPPSADHPRSRGVYFRDGGRAGWRTGSSPGTSARVERSDHPRSREVYRRFHQLRHRRCGSSPLARGLRSPAPTRRGRARIIPARAGFTPSIFPSTDSAGDHPRSRGVYAAADHPRRGWWGSSPLARGLHRLVVERAAVGWIIPARAGFTRL